MALFRERLIATLEAIRPVLEERGVLVVGSQVPNLLQQKAAATLVVSQDVDVAIPVSRHPAVKKKLNEVRGLRPSDQEPSVWVPKTPDLIEVNFLGMDPAISEAGETYVLEDPALPLLVFGYLSLMRPGEPIAVQGLKVPVPRPAGLLLEKLITDRSGNKGDRDLLVALGLLLVATQEDLTELCEQYLTLKPELRHAVRSSLTVLSLMEAHEGMPDPGPYRDKLAALLVRLETAEKLAPP